ncbi:ELMO domain-containing protein 2 isoform X2 [Eublepharis macularius]|uniref:ELMO domain-containing protein 2 isoform X2 n=1 Tax=Eublepharis macularius TaxID=481883 RepID=A0AA97K0I9_EUBMA|nr:ELMO domain-containing protein 2 isoform X2 [Eublepharis macularius]
MIIIHLWNYIYRHVFRFWLKWILRQITGKCELQRICDGSKKSAERTLKIEYSLESSKSKVLQSAVHASEDEVKKYVALIMKEKKINIQKDTGFALKLQMCLLQITGYKKLYLDVEDLRKCPYNSNNKEHEKQLIELWNLLMPHEKLKARITKQWCDIGFQGDDPKTDFRGMGMLGLVNLLYFSKHYPHEARQILTRSNHPTLGSLGAWHALRVHRFLGQLSTVLALTLILLCNSWDQFDRDGLQLIKKWCFKNSLLQPGSLCGTNGSLPSVLLLFGV